MMIYKHGGIPGVGQKHGYKLHSLILDYWTYGGSGVPPGGQKFSGLVAGSER
jgi:hypothetical protein